MLVSGVSRFWCGCGIRHRVVTLVPITQETCVTVEILPAIRNKLIRLVDTAAVLVKYKDVFFIHHKNKHTPVWFMAEGVAIHEGNAVAIFNCRL